MPEIPLDSPLGLMLEYWEECPSRKEKSKERMIHYCMEVWGGKEIRSHLIWPIFGTFEEWACRAINTYVKSKKLLDEEERDYTKIWEGSEVRLFTVTARGGTRTQSEAREPLDNLPPAYLMPLSPSAGTGTPT